MSARTAWLILAKDLRRFRLLVLAAAALTAFAAWFPLHPVLSANDLDPVEIAAGLRFFVIAILGLAIVRDDPAIGVQGGWFSRPIGRGPMIGAKLLFIGLFLAAPAALAGAAGAIALSSSGGDIVFAALEAGMPTLLAAAAGALFGSLTQSYLRTLIAASAVLVAAVFAQHYWESLVHLLAAPRALGFGQFPRDTGDDYKYNWVVMGSALACAAVLIFQYFRRRTGQSAALIAALFALADLAGSGWPGTLWRGPVQALRSPTPLVQLVPAGHELSVERIDTQWFPQPDSIRLSLPVRQEPGGEAGLFWWGQSRFTADDGRTYVMPGTQAIANQGIFMGIVPTGDRPAVFDFAPFGWPAAQLVPKTFAATLLTLPRPEYERLLGTHGHLETWVQFYQPELGVQARIPCVPGAEFARPGGRLRIRSVFVLPNGDVNVTVEHTRLDFQSRGGDPISSGPFVLINPVRNEIAAVYQMTGSKNEEPALATAVRIETYPFHHAWSLATHQPAGDLDETWMKDAQLAVEGGLSGKVSAMSLIDWGEVTMPAEMAKE